MNLLPKDLFFDPRKLFVFGFAMSIVLMLIGVMDYQFRPFNYFFIFFLISAQIPLFFLGKMDLRLKIELPSIIAWGFLILSVLLVGINVFLNGLPNILANFLGGDALNQTTGEYYHKNIKFTAILWPLLSLLIPMSLLVKKRLLKVLLVAWPVVCSLLIQIKSPFIFGLIYFAIFYQITGRKIRTSSLIISVSLVCLLFVVINMTRTSDELSLVAELMGLSTEYQKLNPIIWFPLSYLGGPNVNGLHIMGDEAFNLNLLPYALIMPEALLKEEAREAFLIQSNKTIIWPDTNNAISAVGSFSHMYGLAGMAIFVFVLSLLIFIIGKKRFFGSAFFFALFLIANKCIALFLVGNYFIDSSFLGELIFLYITLSFSKIYFEKTADRTAHKAV